MNQIMIDGWDYVPSQCSSYDYTPCFYFQPDLAWIQYLGINGPYQVPVTIQGTQSGYDGTYWITIDRQNDTALHVGFLPVVFQGFPLFPGQVVLSPPSFSGSTPAPLSCVTSHCC